ncbi:MAG: YxiF family protein [Armatimonadota bacterium]
MNDEIGNESALQKAIDRNRARLILSDWIQIFSNTINHPIDSSDFLDIDETTRLKTIFWEKIADYEIHDAIVWNDGSLDYPIRYLRELDKQVDNIRVCLFHEDDKYIGALQIPSSVIFNNVEKIWNLTRTEIEIITSDAESGLDLEHDYYTSAGEYIRDGFFQLECWGIFDVKGNIK